MKNIQTPMKVKFQGTKKWIDLKIVGEHSPKIKKQIALMQFSQNLRKLNREQQFKKLKLQGQVYKLKDGREFKVENLAPGQLTLIEDGSTLLPLPDGRHELTTGETIVVGKGGVILEVILK